MPGLAKTDEFMVGTATVMIGAQADLFDLSPANSIGLVKNLALTSETSYVELTQGVTNTIVHSKLVSNVVKANCEVYEYTSQNLAYALGLSGTYTTNTVVSNVDAQVSSGTSLVVTAGDGSNFAVDDVIVIENDTEDDYVVRKITAISTDTLTVNAAFNQTINAGATVRKVNSLAVGSKADQAYYSLKAVGKAANGDAIVLMIPKIRITQGFNVQFGSDDYGNMPFEFTVYDQVSTDPHYSYFSGRAMDLIRT